MSGLGDHRAGSARPEAVLRAACASLGLGVVAALVAQCASPAPGPSAAVQVAPEGAVDAPSRAEGTLELLVVDGRDGTPVPDAEVRWGCDTLQPEERPGIFDAWVFHQGREPVSNTWQEFESLRRNGLATRTDADGRALLHRDEYVRGIVAWKDDLWGCEPLDMGFDGSGPRTLLVFPDAPLRVRVVDGDGRPVPSAPVLLEYESSAICVERQSTGSAGEPAVFLHAGAILRKELAQLRSEHFEGFGFQVELDALLVSPVTVGIDPEHLPEEPIDLVMPPCGEVEVLVRDLAGQEVDPAISLALTPFDEGLWEDERLTTRAWSSRLQESWTPLGVQRARSEGGRTVFRHVGLGLDLVAIARRNRASASFGVRGPGPQRSGERTTLTIVLGTIGLNLSGRLWDETGKALADRNVAWRLYAMPGPGSMVPARHRDAFFYPDEAEVTGPFVPHKGGVRTDSQGRIRLDFELDSVWGGRPVLVVSSRDDPGVLRTAMIDVERSWTPGVHDLGDIVLSQAPVLVAGRVVDPDGAPVPGARVILADLGQPHDGALTLTDAAGRFAFLGLTPCSGLNLDVDARGYDSVYEWDLEPGTADLVIRLTRTDPARSPFRVPTPSR